MEENVKVPIKAKDAKIGETYLTEMKRVVTVVAVNRFGEGDDDVSSVSLRGEGSTAPINVSGQTILYAYEVSDVIKAPVNDSPDIPSLPTDLKVAKVKKEPKPKKEKVAKVKKEPKQKMSHIMNEMIFAGKDPGTIADAVIAAFPDQAERRSKLIMLIKGPRTWNLKKRYPERFSGSAPVGNTDEVTTDAPQP